MLHMINQHILFSKYHSIYKAVSAKCMVRAHWEMLYNNNNNKKKQQPSHVSTS